MRILTLTCSTIDKIDNGIRAHGSLIVVICKTSGRKRAVKKTKKKQLLRITMRH